jgi:formylglycine-generating enzyme required for sulfatase activity
MFEVVGKNKGTKGDSPDSTAIARKSGTVPFILTMQTIKTLLIFALLAFNFSLLFGCSRFVPPPKDMVLIPAGEFIMGSDEVDKEAKAMQYGERRPWYANERPKRRVYLKGFYIDRFEVTNAQYWEFVDAKGYRPPLNWPGGAYQPETSHYPAIFVSWYDADSYCKWMGKRLPGEAEWEKAARGTDGRRFPWGDEFDIKKVNTLGEYRGPTPVGEFPDGESPCGVYDMAGNVQEWTADWYKPYPGNDYKDKDYGEGFKVVRGGGWGGVGHYAVQVYIRTTYRNMAPPEGRYDDVGFRCAKDK